MTTWPRPLGKVPAHLRWLSVPPWLRTAPAMGLEGADFFLVRRLSARSPPLYPSTLRTSPAANDAFGLWQTIVGLLLAGWASCGVPAEPELYTVHDYFSFTSVKIDLSVPKSLPSNLAIATGRRAGDDTAANSSEARLGPVSVLTVREVLDIYLTLSGACIKYDLKPLEAASQSQDLIKTRCYYFNDATMQQDEE